MFIVKGSIGNDLILVIRPKLRTFDPPNLLYVGVFEEVTGVGQKHVFFDYLNVGLIHSSSHIHRETCLFWLFESLSSSCKISSSLVSDYDEIFKILMFYLMMCTFYSCEDT